MLDGVMTTRKLFLRYLALPRPRFLRRTAITTSRDPSTGHYHRTDYRSHPWYVKSCPQQRWYPSTWLARLLSRKLPGDDGDRYHPEGYEIYEIGPVVPEDKARKEMDDIREQLISQRRGGCPFSVA